MPKLQDPEDCIDDDPTPSTTMPREKLLCAADYPAEGVEWLWPGRIPIGKVTLMVGDPGNGKSLVALDVAARVSRGRAWPEETKIPLPVLGEATILKNSGEGALDLPPSPLRPPPSAFASPRFRAHSFRRR
jgi:hypothetical protein